MLLRNKKQPSTVLFVAPVSTSAVLLHISAAQQGEQPGAYIRARRANGDTTTTSADVLSCIDYSGDISRTITEVLSRVVKRNSEAQTGDSPFDALGFCTW